MPHGLSSNVIPDWLCYLNGRFPTVGCILVKDPALPMTLNVSIDYSVAMGSLGCWLWKEYSEVPPVAFTKAHNERRHGLWQRYLTDENPYLVGVA